MKKILIQRGSKKGMTLVELLIVIAIIGLIVVAMVPTLFQATIKARDVRRLADLGNMVDAIELFVAEGGSYADITATKGCVGTLFAATTPPITDFLPRGGEVADPSGPHDFSAADNCEYFYCVNTDTGGSNYAIAAFSEGVDSGNIKATTAGEINTNICGVDLAGMLSENTVDSDYYVIIN